MALVSWHIQLAENVFLPYRDRFSGHYPWAVERVLQKYGKPALLLIRLSK